MHDAAEATLSAEDLALLRELPRTIFRVPMKKMLVPAEVLRVLARIERLRMRGLLTATRTFPGRGVFDMTVGLTEAGAEAARRTPR